MGLLHFFVEGKIIEIKTSRKYENTWLEYMNHSNEDGIPASSHESNTPKRTLRRTCFGYIFAIENI